MHAGCEAERGIRDNSEIWGLSNLEQRREACAQRPLPHRRPSTFHDEISLALAAVGHDLEATRILQGHFGEDEQVTFAVFLEAVPRLVGIFLRHLHAIFRPGGRGREGGGEGPAQPWVWRSEGESGARETVLSGAPESKGRSQEGGEIKLGRSVWNEWVTGGCPRETKKRSSQTTRRCLRVPAGGPRTQKEVMVT